MVQQVEAFGVSQAGDLSSVPRSYTLGKVRTDSCGCVDVFTRTLLQINKCSKHLFKNPVLQDSVTLGKNFVCPVACRNFFPAKGYQDV